ncbi:MAG: hypothetical protein CTY13_06085 [Methylobacter sp.]|nr:MAG: hypothetical protein CTY13_06085 [Methylobacter sp.]
MGKSTTAKVNRTNGELTLQQHDSDSPLLPVAQLEQLHSFKPDAVDWVINQTQIEAEYRREETKRLNLFVFIERLIGQACALTIGVTGIIGGSYVALNGHEAAGGTIASVAITGLAAVFLTNRVKK